MRPDLGLWEQLGGATRPAESDPRGRELARVVSGCGRRVATVYQEPLNPMVVIPPYRFTRAHTNMVLFDQVQLDFETWFSERRESECEVTRRLTAALQSGSDWLPVLMVPESRVNVRALALGVAAERERAKSRGDVAGEVTGMIGACARCKATLYLGDDLARWVDDGASATRIFARTSPRFKTNEGFTFPADRISERVGRYERLLALL